jgi:hypothetical protein
MKSIGIRNDEASEDVQREHYVATFADYQSPVEKLGRVSHCRAIDMALDLDLRLPQINPLLSRHNVFIDPQLIPGSVEYAEEIIIRDGGRTGSILNDEPITINLADLDLSDEPLEQEFVTNIKGIGTRLQITDNLSLSLITRRDVGDNRPLGAQNPDYAKGGARTMEALYPADRKGLGIKVCPWIAAYEIPIEIEGSINHISDSSVVYSTRLAQEVRLVPSNIRGKQVQTKDHSDVGSLLGVLGIETQEQFNRLYQRCLSDCEKFYTSFYDMMEVSNLQGFSTLKLTDIDLLVNNSEKQRGYTTEFGFPVINTKDMLLAPTGLWLVDHESIVPQYEMTEENLERHIAIQSFTMLREFPDMLAALRAGFEARSQGAKTVSVERVSELLTEVKADFLKKLEGHSVKVTDDTEHNVYYIDFTDPSGKPHIIRVPQVIEDFDSMYMQQK